MSLEKELEKIQRYVQKILGTVDRIKDEAKLGTPIAKLGLSARTMVLLAEVNVRYVEQLVELNRSDIINLRNVGMHAFNEINEKVKKFGMQGWD